MAKTKNFLPIESQLATRLYEALRDAGLVDLTQRDVAERCITCSTLQAPHQPSRIEVEWYKPRRNTHIIRAVFEESLDDRVLKVVEMAPVAPGVMAW